MCACVFTHTHTHTVGGEEDMVYYGKSKRCEALNERPTRLGPVLRQQETREELLKIIHSQSRVSRNKNILCTRLSIGPSAGLFPSPLPTLLISWGDREQPAHSLA